jgi:hypothetical protein
MKNTTLHTHTNLDSITYTMTRLDVDVATLKLCMRLFMSGASTHSDQIQIKEWWWFLYFHSRTNNVAVWSKEPTSSGRVLFLGGRRLLFLQALHLEPTQKEETPGGGGFPAIKLHLYISLSCCSPLALRSDGRWCASIGVDAREMALMRVKWCWRASNRVDGRWLPLISVD